jgi:Zn-dependent M16 (insulinase) family peptidase
MSSVWRLLKAAEHTEFKLRSKLYEHTVGSRLLHLNANDSNKAFAVMFRTAPKDDKGTPHVLEHTALCGSAKFPIRDPFFHMLKRSLNSYMNAWTGSDFTMYPFSTMNEQDFRNLLSVYLDSAFFPNLREVDFRQEGIR